MNYSGCDGIVKVGDTPTQIIELTGFTIEQATNALDSSIIDGTCDRSVKAGQKSWSGTIEAFYDPGDAGIGELDNGATVDAEFYPTGDEVGEGILSGSILITSVSIPIERDGMITQSMSFEGNGALVIATVPV